MMSTRETDTAQELEPREGTERLTPLDILLVKMRQSWRDHDDGTAVNCAKFAAPFVHARRSAVRGRPQGDVATLTDAELAEALRR